MLSKEFLPERPNWQNRISNKGLDPKKWSEGNMVVVKEQPSGLVAALLEYETRISTELNNLFATGDPLKAPEFPGLRREQVFNAAASSWAHQDPSFPIRFDIAVTKLGGFVLLGAKGDYLEGMIAAASVCKAWHQHHFEGTSDMLEVNYLQEHLIQELQCFGAHSASPVIQDVTILSSERICSQYMATCIGDSSGLKLSDIGVGSLDDIQKVAAGTDPARTKSIIKIDPWVNVLSGDKSQDTWAELFDTPRAFTFQPPWILALDEMLDLSEEVPEDQVDTVINIWLSLNSPNPVPLIVSSQYKDGYRFENSIITPVVMDMISSAVSE